MARSLLLAAAMALVAASGCKKANEDYCCTGADCAEQRSCPVGLVCDQDGSRGGLANSCVEVAGEACGPEDPCDGDLSHCHEGVCVECVEAADCGAGAPVCSQDAFSCGACSDSGECAAHVSAPVCGDDGACRGCEAGGECASDLCDTAAGACVAADDILYVEEGGGGIDCSAVDPCGSINAAIAQAGGTRVWIRVAAGSYAETVAIAGATIRIVADGADLVPGAALQSAIVVRGGADVFIEGLRIHDASGSGTGGDGINCANDVDSPVLVLRRVVIEDNADEGIDAIACSVEVTRSLLRRNDGGAMSLEDSDFTLINNFVYENGPDEPGGISVRGNPPGGAGAARIEHNTIVRNGGPEGIVSGLTCADVTAELLFRNNLIYANNLTAAAEVTGCEHEYSLVGPTEADGRSNVAGPPTYVDQGADDYRLDRGSAGIDAAAPSDVHEDFEGDARPAGDAPDTGADESQQ